MLSKTAETPVLVMSVKATVTCCLCKISNLVLKMKLYCTVLTWETFWIYTVYCEKTMPLSYIEPIE